MRVYFFSLLYAYRWYAAGLLLVAGFASWSRRAGRLGLAVAWIRLGVYVWVSVLRWLWMVGGSLWGCGACRWEQLRGNEWGLRGGAGGSVVVCSQGLEV